MPTYSNNCIQTPEVVGEQIDPSESSHFKNIVKLVLVLGLRHNLSHGDLTFGNIIFDQNKYTFIDFEFSREGGPYIDLAHLLFNILNYEYNVGNNDVRKNYSRKNFVFLTKPYIFDHPMIHKVYQFKTK